MITWQRADSKVSALMGENKGIKEGDAVRPSLYAIPFRLGGKEIVFHTLTRQCVETDHFALFEKPRSLIYNEKDPEMRELVKADFLVPSDRDEVSKYTGLLTLLRRAEAPKAGFTGYTILPTTACNARCLYCYEEGLPHEMMGEAVLEQTVQYILATRKKDSPLRFHFFGGEPTLGEKTIDRICDAMEAAEISFTSGMISNGSLINDAMARKAKEKWHLKNIQITLDGREEVYCQRKRYHAFSGSPYRAVLKGIHALLEQEIRVNIRLNVDENNLKELMLLTEELEEEFKEESLISLYCHSIFAEEGDDPCRDNEALYAGMAELNDKLAVFNRNRRERHKGKETLSQEPAEDADIDWEPRTEAAPEAYYDRQGKLKRYYCMVDNPAVGPVILPDGRLNLCEHIGELPVVGSVYEKEPVKKEEYVTRGREKNEKCRRCPLLPSCTDFSGCPTRCRDCYRETLAKEKNALRWLESEDRLPPVNIKKDGRILRVTEPDRAFLTAHREDILPSYLKPEETIKASSFFTL